MSFFNRLQHAWNAFTSRDPTEVSNNSLFSYGGSLGSTKPDRVRFTRGNERTIINAIYNRIAIDCSMWDVCHVRLDDQGRYIETIPSKLNECLRLCANVDQTATAFFQSTVMSLLDEGCVAIVPVDTTFNPRVTGSYDITSLRTGKITNWYPDKVTIDLYNDTTGKHEEVTLPKSVVAIVENPFYSVMNEPNSILQRLIRKLALLDSVDEQNGSGKLDMIIQLPYVVKSSTRREQAEARRKSIEMQLRGSEYGIAYIDGTEKITQLNRSIDNQLMAHVEYFTSMLYGQLGITQEIMDGSANEQVMLNYKQRTIKPILRAILDEMKRKFLTKTARAQKQSIVMFDNPFSLVPITEIIKLGEAFIRSEIVTPNEIRQVLGLKPSQDPTSDALRNTNLNATPGMIQYDVNGNPINQNPNDIQNEEDYDPNAQEYEEEYQDE